MQPTPAKIHSTGKCRLQSVAVCTGDGCQSAQSRSAGHIVRIKPQSTVARELRKLAEQRAEEIAPDMLALVAGVSQQNKIPGDDRTIGSPPVG